MNNGDAELRQPIARDKFPYTFRIRYCACGQLFNLQYDKRTDRFLSAAANLDSKAHKQTIVTHCPTCGAAIDAVWLDECLTAAPEVKVHGRD